MYIHFEELSGSGWTKCNVGGCEGEGQVWV